MFLHGNISFVLVPSIFIAAKMMFFTEPDIQFVQFLKSGASEALVQAKHCVAIELECAGPRNQLVSWQVGFFKKPCSFAVHGVR